MEMQQERDIRAAQVRRLVREVLGEEPLRVSHQDFGHRSLTFDVCLPGRALIVRTNTEAGVFSGTARNLALLRDLGLPVPSIIAADLTRAHIPFAYLILDKIPGRDLRDELGTMTVPQMTRLAEQLMDFQRRVSTLPAGLGYGYVPLGAPGTHETWWDLLRPKPTTERDGWGSRIGHALRRHESYFRQVPPICFLDDLTVKNMIVQDGALQGLVDFDVVCYGDPIYWLSLTATVVVCDVGVRELFYVEELCRCYGLTHAQRQIFALYAAHITLGFLQRFADRETDAWRQRMQEALERWWATYCHSPG